MTGSTTDPVGVSPSDHLGRPVPWGSVLLTALSAVGWAFVAMAAVAALGLHLLDADRQAALGPMTAALVTMAAGGQVSPSGDVSVFGIHGASAGGAIDVIPLGVALAGALPLAWVFVAPLRRAGAVIRGGELVARVLTVMGLFLVVLAWLAWAGHDTVSIKGSSLGGGGNGGVLNNLPGIGDLGNLGQGLGDSLNNLVKDNASVGFRADVGASLAGGVLWVLVVLALAMLVSRRTPLPRHWEPVHRAVRPAASALCSVLLLAVAAGIVIALYSAIGDPHPGRIIGGALIGAPNGVWLGTSLGLFVPWHGSASGPLTHLLPHPLDQLLGTPGHGTVTLSRLAQLDGRAWLLPVAAGLMMLAAGVLAAARTPVTDASRAHFTARCAVRLAICSALALPLLGWLADVAVNASLSVFGFDAVGAGVNLRAGALWSLLLGAVWGAAAGALGALLAYTTGAAGTRATPLAQLAAEPAGPPGSPGRRG